MQNETGNVSATLAAPPSTSELCQQYTNAIFYNVGMPLYGVCKYKERIILNFKKYIYRWTDGWMDR